MAVCGPQLSALQDACEATGQFRTSDGHFDLHECVRESAADAAKREIAKKAARDQRRAVTNAPRKDYWACVKAGLDCSEAFTLLRTACELSGEYQDAKGQLDVGLCQGDRP